MTWYGVRSVVEHAAKGGHLYEERVVVFDAADEDTAFELAEREAADYCSSLDDCEPLGLFQLNVIGEEPIVSGSEVFSLMRTSQLEPSAYLNDYFNTGDELERH